VLAPGKNFMIWFLLMSIPPFHVFWNLETAPETRVPCALRGRNTLLLTMYRGNYISIQET
jgi:hypothetical protein